MEFTSRPGEAQPQDTTNSSSPRFVCTICFFTEHGLQIMRWQIDSSMVVDADAQPEPGDVVNTVCVTFPNLQFHFSFLRYSCRSMVLMFPACRRLRSTNSSRFSYPFVAMFIGLMIASASGIHAPDWGQEAFFRTPQTDQLVEPAIGSKERIRQRVGGAEAQGR